PVERLPKPNVPRGVATAYWLSTQATKPSGPRGGSATRRTGSPSTKKRAAPGNHSTTYVCHADRSVVRSDSHVPLRRCTQYAEIHSGPVSLAHRTDAAVGGAASSA